MKLIVDFYGMDNAWFEGWEEGAAERWALLALTRRLEDHPLKVGDTDHLRDGNGNKVVSLTVTE